MTGRFNSSLSYLKQLPLGQLKIDHSFVLQAPTLVRIVPDVAGFPGRFVHNQAGNVLALDGGHAFFDRQGSLPGDFETRNAVRNRTLAVGRLSV